jgi:hypothetical protein
MAASGPSGGGSKFRFGSNRCGAYLIRSRIRLLGENGACASLHRTIGHLMAGCKALICCLRACFQQSRRGMRRITPLMLTCLKDSQETSHMSLENVIPLRRLFSRKQVGLKPGPALSPCFVDNASPIDFNFQRESRCRADDQRSQNHEFRMEPEARSDGQQSGPRRLCRFPANGAAHPQYPCRVNHRFECAYGPDS